MIRLSEYPAREKGTDDVDWSKLPYAKYDMNFRPLRDEKAELKRTKHFLTVASVCSAIALVTISVINALCPFLFDNTESLFLLGCAAVVPIVLGNYYRGYKNGRGVYFALVCLLLVSNLGILFLGERRGDFYGTVFLFAIVPTVLFTVDTIAGHYVHWVTASPRMDLKTMESLRAVWRERFGRGLFRAASISTEGRHGSEESVEIRLKQISFYPVWLVGTFSICFFGVFAANLIAPEILTGQASLVLVALFTGIAAIWMHRKDDRLVTTVSNAFSLFCVLKPIKKAPATIQFQRSYIYRGNLLFATVLALSFAVNAFWFPLALVSFGFVGSAAGMVINTAIQFVVVFVLAPVLLFAFAMIAIGPTLRMFEELCEGKEACLGNEGWSEFDGYTNRLINSGNPDEAECAWLGFHKEMGFPILVPNSLLREHVHILGGSGSGKTGLGISTLAAQFIKRNEGPVIVIDGKGDNSLFQSVKRWSDEENRKFKWFTTAAGKSTYLFNPLGQKAIEKFTLSEIVGFMLLSFNLFHGSDYGRSWFTQASKSALADTLKHGVGNKPGKVTLRSFLEKLDEVIAASGKKHESAKHVQLLMETLAEFPQLQHPADKNGNPHPACEHAIEMMDVIKKNQVVYFSFESLTDPSSAGELSRAIVYSVIAAAMSYEQDTGKPPKVTIIVDEAQNVAAKNIGTAVEQARSMGVSFVFAHQTRDQLKLDGATDLRPVIDNCTAVKLIYSANDTQSMDNIERMSGEVGYVDASWKQFVDDVSGGNATMKYALMYDGSPAEAQVRMKVGPRLTKNEIQDSSAAPNGCIIAVTRKRGLAQYNGAFPIRVDYPITQEQYENNLKARWPPSDEIESIKPPPYWPEPDAETTIRDAAASLPSETEDTSKVLRDLAEGVFGTNTAENSDQ